MFERFTDRSRRVVVLAQDEARMLNHEYVGTEHILLRLIREDEGAAMRVLNGLGADPNMIRQQVIRLVSARQIHEEPGTGRAGGRGKRKQLSELRHQLAAVSWRLSVLEQRVGTTPDLAQLDREIAQIRRDRESAIDAQDFENAAVLRGREQRLVDGKAARLQEWAALPSLSDEVERLRDLLRRHGIDPEDGVA
jgi:ATP-dependent Clp protease ATP-binding subunit ClpC